MKTKLNLRLSVLFFSMLFLSNSFAQKVVQSESGSGFSAANFSMAFPSPKNELISNENISKKVLKHFNKSFKNAENIKWEQVDDNFLATFVMENVITKSLFDKKGKLIYSINYISEKQLPVNIRNLVTNTYINYTITSVAKILQDNLQIWIVKLADESDYVAAMVEDGDVIEIENFRKAN